MECQNSEPEYPEFPEWPQNDELKNIYLFIYLLFRNILKMH